MRLKFCLLGIAQYLVFLRSDFPKKKPNTFIDFQLPRTDFDLIPETELSPLGKKQNLGAPKSTGNDRKREI